MQIHSLEVVDIVFDITLRGNLVPYAVLDTPDGDWKEDQQLASLNNLDNLRRMDVRIGDFVTASSKEGHDTYQIDKVLKHARETDVVPVEIPTRCPVCRSKLTLIGDRKPVPKCMASCWRPYVG